MSRMRSSIGISRRSSLSGNPDAKRSSIGGSTRAVVKDPRPVVDKGYVKDGITTLSAFLHERGYEGACSQKDLRLPSTLCITNIFKFLIQALRPRHEISKLDEVPQSMFLLGYPLKLNKSWLAAVGSPKAWPNLLAAMLWLCHANECSELCEANDQVFGGSGDELTMFPGEDEGKPAKQRRQDFHADAYRVFMQYGDSDVESSEYKQQCDMKETQLIQSIQQYDGQMETCRREIEQSSADPAPLKAADMALQCFSDDKRKFEVLIQQLEEHVQQLSLHIHQKAEQQQDEERLFASLEAERQQLQARVACQPMSSSDVKRLAAESEQLNSERRALRQKLDALEKETWQAEMDCNKKAKSLEEEKQMILSSGFDLANNTFVAIQERHLMDEDALRRQRRSLQEELEKSQQMAFKQREFVSALENDLEIAKADHKRSLQHLEDELQREQARSEQHRSALHSRLESKGEGGRLAEAHDALRQAQQRLERGRQQFKAEVEERLSVLNMAMSKIADHLSDYDQVLARANVL